MEFPPSTLIKNHQTVALSNVLTLIHISLLITHCIAFCKQIVLNAIQLTLNQKNNHNLGMILKLFIGMARHDTNQTSNVNTNY